MRIYDVSWHSDLQKAETKRFDIYKGQSTKHFHHTCLRQELCNDLNSATYSFSTPKCRSKHETKSGHDLECFNYFNFFYIGLFHQESPQWVYQTLGPNTISSLAPTRCIPSPRHPNITSLVIPSSCSWQVYLQQLPAHIVDVSHGRTISALTVPSVQVHEPIATDACYQWRTEPNYFNCLIIRLNALIAMFFRDVCYSFNT